jgi:hypothetical protein
MARVRHRGQDSARVHDVERVLNLGIRWVYHPWMGVDGEEGNLNDFNADEY